MTSFIEKLNAAKIDGISVLISTESADRGKKTVIHEYPNSDFRYVEELGKLPPVFNLTAIVHGNDSFNQRLRLEQALEKTGLIEIVHPIYGTLMVKSLDFSVSSSQTEVGQFVFNIRFAQSVSNATPTPATPTNATITDLAAKFRTNLNNRFEEIYVPPVTAENYEHFIETLQGVFDTVNDEIANVVGLSSTGASAFNRVYRTVTNNITSIVSDAFELKQNITLFYDAALDAPVFVEQLANAWDRLLQEPLTVSSPPKTARQSIAQQNDYAITEHMRLTALANSYEAKVYTDFTTDESLADARAFLNDNYKIGLKKKNEEIEDAGLESLACCGDVRQSFEDLRSLSRKVFDEKEKAVFRITTIDPGMTSMALTAYRFYGNLDYIDQLVTLNPSVNHANFNSEIKALTG